MIWSIGRFSKGHDHWALFKGAYCIIYRALFKGAYHMIYGSLFKGGIPHHLWSTFRKGMIIGALFKGTYHIIYRALFKGVWSLGHFSKGHDPSHCKVWGLFKGQCAVVMWPFARLLWTFVSVVVVVFSVALSCCLFDNRMGICLLHSIHDWFTSRPPRGLVLLWWPREPIMSVQHCASVVGSRDVANVHGLGAKSPEAVYLMDI